MFTLVQCENIINIENIQFEDVLDVDCLNNKLIFPQLNKKISITESQKRLLICLLKNITSKKDIISVVWCESQLPVRSNNYHQMVFQLRALFQRNQLPAGILVTVPYYGLKLDKSLLRKINQPAQPEIKARHTRTESVQRHSPANSADHSPAWLNTLRGFFSR